MKGELFFHARDIGIGEVGAVEVVEEVGEAAEGEDEEVDFEEQFGLGGVERPHFQMIFVIS